MAFRVSACICGTRRDEDRHGTLTTNNTRTEDGNPCADCYRWQREFLAAPPNELRRLRDHAQAWQDACNEALGESGVGRMAHMDCFVITGEKLCELQAKAAKWDAYERNNTIKIRTVHGDMTIKPDPTLRRDEVRLGLLPKRIEDLPTTRVHAPQESGPGLRAQPGKYTEPGHVKIYCDNGNDE